MSASCPPAGDSSAARGDRALSTTTPGGGDFSFLPSADARMFKNAYDAITAEGLWDFFRDQTPPANKGYMFWSAPELKKLEPHLEPMGHSGSSYGMTMRAMEAIAKKGWEQFVFENSQDEPGTPLPLLPPAPLARCGPSGEDPYEEDRARARAEAAAGCPCPVNQHGCMYFSASEWTFCPMCEWEIGSAQGQAAGTLNALGVSKAVRSEESARGQDLSLTRQQLLDVLKKARSYQLVVPDAEWALLRNGNLASEDYLYLTRTELHNVLMRHGAAARVLEDDALWAELQAAYQ